MKSSIKVKRHDLESHDLRSFTVHWKYVLNLDPTQILKCLVFQCFWNIKLKTKLMHNLCAFLALTLLIINGFSKFFFLLIASNYWKVCRVKYIRENPKIPEYPKFRVWIGSGLLILSMGNIRTTFENLL